MANINKFDVQSIETLSNILANILTGSKITAMLNHLNLEDTYPKDTKWIRINHAMVASQSAFRCGNKIIEIIEYVFHPTSTWFIDVNHYNEEMKLINKCISFYGLELHTDGKIYPTVSTTSKREANERYDLLKSKLSERNIHPEIMKFCTQDIVNEDYFSIIFEASKSIYVKIRNMTGINLDGNKLIYNCFDLKFPIVVFNSLKSETEINLYNGLKNMLLSIAQLGRNPKAHTPKIYSYDNLDNCLDILNLISLAHKMLDQCTINQSALNQFMKSQ